MKSDIDSVIQDLRFDSLLYQGLRLCLKSFTKIEEKMPKQKTHKGLKKRFKITASGQAKHRKAFRGHILSKKSPKRKISLRNDGVVTGAEAKLIVDALRPGS